MTFSVSLRRLVNGGGSESGSFPFILNDKCHYPPGPNRVWRSDVTTVRKSLVLVRRRSPFLGGIVASVVVRFSLVQSSWVLTGLSDS